VTTEQRRTGRQSLIEPAEEATLAAIVRALYPHPGLGDGPYERVAALVLDEAVRTPALALAVRNLLTVVATYGSAREADEVAAALAAVTSTRSFETVRSRACHHLYADREVWEHIGYPGESFPYGGYLHRGFDDLAWLPDPRVEECPEPRTEVVTGRRDAARAEAGA
jgi:hypothetical protein